jgi:hypothetical protein
MTETMSTKIYRGFRFRSHDLFDIHNVIAAWRIELAELQRRDMASVLAGLSLEIIDRNAVNPRRNAGKNPFRAAREEVRTRQKEILGSGLRDPEVDFDFELSILPHEGRIYGMVFSERPHWVNRWLAKDEVEDFSYWNSTDRPDGVSEEEWGTRGGIWQRIFQANPAGTPGMAGFSAQCTDRLLQPRLDDVLDSIQPFDARVAARARECAMDRGYAAMLADGVKVSDNPFAVISKIEKWLEDGGAHVLEEETRRVAQLIPSKINAEILTTSLPDVVAEDVGESGEKQTKTQERSGESRSDRPAPLYNWGDEDE